VASGCTLRSEAETKKANGSRFEIVAQTHLRGGWFLKPTRGVPFGLWHGDRAHAVSYAEWVAREVGRAEIIVRNRDGTLADRRLRGRLKDCRC
jgi:hypothetical protein